MAFEHEPSEAIARDRERTVLMREVMRLAERHEFERLVRSAVLARLDVVQVGLLYDEHPGT